MTEGLPNINKNNMTPTVTQGHCPTPQNSPTSIPMNAVAATPTKPPLNRDPENPTRQEKSTPWMAHMFKETATQGSI